MRKKLSWVFRLAIIAVLLVFLVGSYSSNTQVAKTTSTNLVYNPGMENGIWNHFSPGHYVADGWWRWWIDGDFLPEWYSTTEAERVYEGTHAQRWHGLVSEGETWRAGMYQMVEVVPCVNYEFSAWSRMHVWPTTSGSLHHKVGLDPYGRQYTASEDDAAVKDDSMSDIVYSEEQENYYVYEHLSVQTEALNSQVSVVLFSYNERYDGAPPAIPYDSHYDATSLVEVPFDNDRLPTPDYWSTTDIIYNVNTITSPNEITISWNTMLAGSTQVWYDYYTPTEPISITTPLSYTVYAPWIAGIYNPGDYSYHTEIDTTPKTSHSVTITGLPDGVVVQFAPLSRYLENNVCTTSGYTPQKADLP